MAVYMLFKKDGIFVLLVFLSRMSFVTLASSVSGCNDTGIQINIDNTTLSGNLTSPSYPNWTPENSSCIWVLNCAKGRLIKLYFHELIFNNSSENYTQLEIHDGGTSRSPLIIKFDRKLNQTVPIIYSSGNKLSLHLKVGSKETSVRFHVWYSSSNPGKTCSANNSDDENNNIILKPPFLLTLGQELPSEVDCTWKMPSTVNSQQINLTLNISNNLFCRTGNVYIFDGPYGSASGLKKNLCQEQAGIASFSSKTGLSFQLKSSNFSSAVLQVKANVIEEDCIMEGSSYVTRHKSDYSSKIDCQRKFSSPVGFLLEFQFVIVSLPDGCSNNSVQIFELQKHSNKSTLRAKFCGTHIEIPKIVIFSGYALVKIKAEASREDSSKYKGFLTHIWFPLRVSDWSHCTQLNSPEKNANLKLTDHRGFFSSPSSYKYPPGMFCKWRLQPNNMTEKQQIEIEMSEFFFSKGYNKDCTQDHLELDFNNGRIEKYCRARSPPPVIYSGNAKSISITFVSTPLYTGNMGFKAYYKVVPIVTPSKRLLTWTVIGVLIASGCLLLACIAFCIYRYKKKKKIEQEMQRVTNETEENAAATEELAILPPPAPIPEGPPPPYTGKPEDVPIMDHPTEEQPYPWFSPGTTIMKHSPRERRPDLEEESKV